MKKVNGRWTYKGKLYKDLFGREKLIFELFFKEASWKQY